MWWHDHYISFKQTRVTMPWVVVVHTQYLPSHIIVAQWIEHLLLTNYMGQDSSHVTPTLFVLVLLIIRTLSNFCSFLEFAMPPRKKALPRTNNMLDKIDPKSDNCTTRTMLLRIANMHMINSVAFPKVAFNNPPTVREREERLTIGHPSVRAHDEILKKIQQG